MNQIQREAVVMGIEDESVREVAWAHPECLHPCVWLVQDEKGPLVAGGLPRLPVGREWPRDRGQPLAYLLSIDAALLPAWSPLPRDCGRLLVFVGGVTCEIVVVGPGAETREVEPPVEEYWGNEPIAGDALEVMRFRLEEGLQAGVPESWNPNSKGDDAPEQDEDLAESLTEVHRALKPKNCIGRLFGHHEWWVSADAAAITRYSYLDVNGYRWGWYQDLDGSLERLQEQLEAAKLQQAPAHEPMPMIADAVVQACETWVADAEKKFAARRDVADQDARANVESARQVLARRWTRWQAVKAADSEAANLALEQLIASASEISRTMELIPTAKDAEEFEIQRKAIEERESEKERQWSQRVTENMREEARIRREHFGNQQAFDAAMKVFRESRGIGQSKYSELIAFLTPMQYACREDNCDLIRKTWMAYEAKLNECAGQLKAAEIGTALHWRLQCYQSLTGWMRRGYRDPAQIAEWIAAVRWWQGDVGHHEAELVHWRPLLVLESDRGPYFWGDAGWAIILADQRAVGKGQLGRLAVAVDVS